ncbi:hypothetical protein ABZY36_03335 [Streptomyces sp. NPDC006627]|uniref:hypothetical protein n=1 Tax=Streptomyces sp. NPDC006627 TaxID=3154679 RepID=UPI0033BB0BFA
MEMEMEVDVDVGAGADRERVAIAGKGVGGSADPGVDDSSAAFSGGPFLDSGEHCLGHAQLHAVGFVLAARAIEQGGDMGEVTAPWGTSYAPHDRPRRGSTTHPLQRGTRR